MKVTSFAVAKFMKPFVRYPGVYSSDFPEDVNSKVSELLLKDLKKVFQELRGSDPLFLVAVLRRCLTSELTEKSVSIIGWCALNSLMPVQTLYVFMSILISKIATEDGERLCIILGKALLPQLHRYVMLCKALHGIQNLRYLHPDLFSVVNQVMHETIEIDIFETSDHFVIPTTKSHFPPFREVAFPKFRPSKDDDKDLLANGTFWQSIMNAELLRGDQQKEWYVAIMNQFPLPLDLDNPPWPLLETACSYANHLLEDDRSNLWTDSERYERLERIGSWIGLMSLKRKRPPPLKWISIEYALRWAIVHGTFRRALAFVTGFLSKYKIRPPNRLCVIIFEIIAGVKQNRCMKDDIPKAITAFESRFQVNLDDYARRQLDVPINSFNRCAQFVASEDRVVFESPENLNPGSDVYFLSDSSSVSTYFHYTSDLSLLPKEFMELSQTARMIERYFFQGAALSVNTPSYDVPEHVLINSLMSMTWSGSAILANLAARMFHKYAKTRGPMDLAYLFRIAFPNRLALFTCLESECVHPSDINDLFCDLLSSPVTKDIALPRIKSLLPVCFANSDPKYYEGVLRLCGMEKPVAQQATDIGMPSAKHYKLLELFTAYCETNGEKLEFVEQLRNASMGELRSLLLFVFHVTKKTSSPLNSTRIDYSTIDFLCFSITKCVGKPKFEERLIGAIRQITPEVMSSYPLSLFRLLYGLLNVKFQRNEEALIQFIEFFEPRRYPAFSCCWIQLCTHRSLFPRLVQLNTSKTSSFCVRFVLICLELCKQQPQIFYKGIARILMTIASAHPLFFVSYHALFIEKIPLLYTQFRNIILGAQAKNGDELPPMGFKCGAIVAGMGHQSLVKDGHFSDEKAVKVAKVMKRSLVPATPYVPRIVWALVVFYLSGCRDGVTDFFVSVCQQFQDPSVRMVYVALIDQLRYDNPITRDATEVLLAAFDRCDNMHKELIVVEILRRIVCVTKPPASVFGVFQQLMARFKDQITGIMNENGELKTFHQALEIVNRDVYQLNL